MSLQQRKKKQIMCEIMCESKNCPKHARYGLPGERKKRWCSSCAAAIGNKVVRVQQPKMCEGCGLKAPTYGLPAERKKRWCSGCAAGESGAVRLQKPKMCEGCGLKAPTFGLQTEQKKRWCCGCALAQGAVRLQSHK